MCSDECQWAVLPDLQHHHLEYMYQRLMHSDKRQHANRPAGLGINHTSKAIDHASTNQNIAISYSSNQEFLHNLYEACLIRQTFRKARSMGKTG
jgi:hypothetical protein